MKEARKARSASVATPVLSRQPRPSCVEGMEPNTCSLHAVSDDDLLHRLGELVSQYRRIESDLVAHIGEADERRLFARLAFPSMFAYCTQALHLSEAEAYRRITVARAARRFPV